MSMEKFLQENYIVDSKESEFYFVNRKKRLFWHNRSLSISCRVRNRNEFNKAREFSANVRAFLLNEEPFFLKKMSAVMTYLTKEDQKQLRNYVYARFSDIDKEELDKNMGLIIRDFSKEEIRDALNLEDVVSCRLLGYEKELFFLKSYIISYLPVFLLRVLYHTKYSHLKLLKSLENEDDLYKGINFEEYLEKITFY